MKCPKCGKEIANDSVYCEYCGAKVQNNSQSFNNVASGSSVSFFHAIKVVWRKYAVFTGRANRSEYWWWTFFSIILNFCGEFIDCLLWENVGIFTLLVSLALFLPGLSVAVRRCHDTNHSGWWLLCPLYNLVLMLIPSDEEVNEYGILSE